MATPIRELDKWKQQHSLLSNPCSMALVLLYQDKHRESGGHRVHNNKKLGTENLTSPLAGCLSVSDAVWKTEEDVRHPAQMYARNPKM